MVRGGALFRLDGAAVGDEVFHGDDDGEGLDLAGDAVSGHFGAEVGNLPETLQHLIAFQVKALQALGLLLDSSAVLADVSANIGFGFDVGSGFGVEADGLGGLTVGHRARKDLAGEGYFLIGDGSFNSWLGMDGSWI